jgi:hypothetical protein
MSQQAKRTKVSPEEDEESSDSRDSDSPFDDDNSKEDPFPVLSLQSAAYLTFRRSELQGWFDKPVLSFGNEEAALCSRLYRNLQRAMRYGECPPFAASQSPSS